MTRHAGPMPRTRLFIDSSEPTTRIYLFKIRADCERPSRPDNDVVPALARYSMLRAHRLAREFSSDISRRCHRHQRKLSACGAAEDPDGDSFASGHAGVSYLVRNYDVVTCWFQRDRYRQSFARLEIGNRRMVLHVKPSVAPDYRPVGSPRAVASRVRSSGRRYRRRQVYRITHLDNARYRSFCTTTCEGR